MHLGHFATDDGIRRQPQADLMSSFPLVGLVSLTAVEVSAGYDAYWQDPWPGLQSRTSTCTRHHCLNFMIRGLASKFKGTYIVLGFS